MGELTREFDWSRTPLGSPNQWPQSLRLAVRLLLTSRHPMFIWWGPDLIQFYNDAYRRTMGPERHPIALGQPGRRCWEEIWDVIGPQIDLVMAGQGSTWHEDQLVPVTRHGRREDVWWTYGYSPIHDDEAPGGVGGVLVVCNDVTAQRQAVDALRTSQYRLRLALDASQLVAVWEWDLTTDMVRGDSRFARMHGLDPGQAEAGLPRADAHANVHPEDRGAVGAEARKVIANGEQIDLKFRLIDEDGQIVWTHAHALRQADADGRGVRYLGATIDITEGRAAEQRLRGLFEQAPGFIAVLKGPEHVFELHNDAYLTLVGGRPVQGLPARDALPEVEGQGFFEQLDAVYATGEAFVARGAEIMLPGKARGTLEQHFVDFVYQPIRDPGGRVGGIFVQGQDITEQKRAEEHRELLINELNHRVKNTLATIQAVAQQTLRDDIPMPLARTAFIDRLLAMSRSHDILTEQNWQGAELIEVIEKALEAHVPPERLLRNGPAVRLDARAALAMSLALHELATNAAKYGALSTDAGRVDLTWIVAEYDGQRRLCLEWRERGGPPVEPPRRKGFGARLIERGLAQELNGEATLLYEPEGLICRIEAPLGA